MQPLVGEPLGVADAAPDGGGVPGGGQGMGRLKLSAKGAAFLRCKARCEFLEGTTYAGKTTLALLKFVLRCAASPRRLHILSGLDTGTIEKNIIDREFGILEDFGALIDYRPAGKGGVSAPHLLLRTSAGERVIYVLGYDNRARWKKALGGQYGCVMIDEVNIADMEYLREAAMRCDYLLATLNPDDPRRPVYTEYIDHARPLPAWAADTPAPLLAQLCQPAREGWVHWFFGFGDNAALSPEKRRRIAEAAQPGTPLYRSKILGLRGRGEGLVFDTPPDCVVDADALRRDIAAGRLRFVRFACGVDTSYSRRSDDTFAFVYNAFTADRRKVTLAAQTYSNRERAAAGLPPLAPSDIPALLEGFLARMRAEWGFGRRVFIDSADQATLTECRKHRRLHGSLYEFVPAWKRLGVLDRIRLECGWLAHRQHLFVRQGCAPLLTEMACYSWADDGRPEDANDHCINAEQYAWMAYWGEVGE